MTAKELECKLLDYRFRCQIETRHLRIKKDSPIWGWFLFVKKDNRVKKFELWKYKNTNKLIKEFIAFAEDKIFDEYNNENSN
jgi:hypothetical protein